MKNEDLRLAVKKYGSVRAAALALNIPRTTLQRRLAALPKVESDQPANSQKGSVAPNPDVEFVGLRDRIRSLETQLASYHRETLSERYIKEKIIGLAESTPTVPEWLLSNEISSNSPGVPTLFASDWHAGEVVDPNQINGVNEYNLDIFERRARQTVFSTIDLLFNHMVNPNYPGIVFALGGDMVSGDIHDELSATNEKEIMPVVLRLWGVLKWCIDQLKARFGRVFVPAVPGNHSRTTHKIRAKGRNFTSFDWLVYQFLAKCYENDPDVMLFIPDGPDALYSVYGHRYMLTHGDQFRGGDGLIGFLGPLCVAPDTKILKSDLSYVRADELVPGDVLVGFDEEPPAGKRRTFQLSTVEEVRELELECYEVETSDGQKTIASVDHPWLCRSGDSHAWMKTCNMSIGTRVISLGEPWEKENTYEAGYLAGVLDGEGTMEASGRVKFAQQDNACLAKTVGILSNRGIPYRISENGAASRGFEPCYQVALFNGREDEPRDKIRADTWRLLGQIRPERLIAEQFERSMVGVSVQVAKTVEVVGIRKVGMQKVAAFSTSTKTFVGNGMLMHNTRGDHKKRSRNASIYMGYDTMLVGHWHQLFQSQKLIANGSLVGYNEYAYVNNFSFETPKQALWITHPERGITFHMAVHCEPVKQKGSKSNWVGWKA